MIFFKKGIFLLAGIFIVLSVLNGCSSLGGPSPQPPVPPAKQKPEPEPGPGPEKDRSFLYFYRAERFPFALGALPISINDRLVARLKNNSYTWISVPVGTYNIRLTYGVRLPIPGSSEMSSGRYYESEEINITAEKGHSYFFRAEEFFEYKLKYGLVPIIRFSFDAIDQTDALEEIKGARYFEPEEPGFGEDEGFNGCRGPVGCNE